MSTELDRILEIAADVFDADAKQVSVESTPATIENWDSITHLNFVVALEQAFGFAIEPEESDRMSKGLGETLAIVKTKLGVG